MTRACLLICLTPWLPVAAQDISPGARHRTLAEVPSPNVSLPAHVQAPPGRLTLFADLLHPNAQGIPLYLVNRTAAAVTLSCQDGDIYLKLEHQLPDGTWQRAQTHQYSDCGNSYVARVLSPGTHYAMHGYRPARGEPAKIRYASYGSIEIVSNAGEGIFAPEDVRAAAMDPMTLQGVPYILRNSFDLRQRTIPLRSPVSPRLAALRTLKLLGEIPLLRAGAQAWLDQLQAATDPTPDERLALPLVKEILARDWGPREQDLHSVLLACLAAFRSKAPGEFGTLAKERSLAWHIVAEVGQLEFRRSDRGRQPRSDDNLWQDILIVAAQTARTGTAQDPHPIAEILSLTPLVDQLLPDAHLEPLLGITNFTAASATALSRRGRWERLSELGLKLSPEQQVIVLAALSYAPVNEQGVNYEGSRVPRRPPYEGPELVFWQQVLKNQPVEAAAALSRNFLLSNYNPYRGELFAPIRSHWLQELKRVGDTAKDFEMPRPAANQARLSVEFIAAAKDKADIPLLNSLLHHRGYEKQEGVRFDKTTNLTTQFVKRIYPIRLAAAQALRALGEPVPVDTVLEEEIAGSQKTVRR